MSSPGNDSATVPVTSQIEFALTPLCKEGDGTDGGINDWEGEFHSVGTFLKVRKSQNMPMPVVSVVHPLPCVRIYSACVYIHEVPPSHNNYTELYLHTQFMRGTLQALKVLDDTLDHNKKNVSASTILFNIRKISQWVGLQKRRGIEGVDRGGTVHRFLEGKEPLYFSTRLYDVKCLPMHLTKVLQFPKTARVYMHPNTEDQNSSLENLSTVIITEVGQVYHLVVRKLSDSGGRLGPTFTIPWNADLKVGA